MADTALPTAFAFQAQSIDGGIIAGTLEAPAITDAAGLLQKLGLHVTRLQPAEKKNAAKSPFRAGDFLAFNQQLAALTGSGLPIERSLRLVAAEMQNKRHTAALERIAAQLEKGTPLPDAFATEQASFPPLYAHLLEAGVKSNNLSGMLLNLGRHVQLLQRLRAAWWRAAAYPLTVLFSLLVLMIFIWTCVIPKFAPLAMGPAFRHEAQGYRPIDRGSLQASVDWTLTAANVIGYSVMGLIACLLTAVLILCLMNRSPTGRERVEKIALPLPVIGPILRWNLVARWCDALQLGISGGLTLPAAFELARDAVPSPKLRSDSQNLIDTVEAGRSLELESSTHFLPPLVPATLQMGIERNDLQSSAAMLSLMYQEQAEIRLAVLPRLVSPLLLMLTAVCIGLAVASMLMPLLAMIQAIAGPTKL